jgi:hypothetical protein
MQMYQTSNVMQFKHTREHTCSFSRVYMRRLPCGTSGDSFSANAAKFLSLIIENWRSGITAITSFRFIFLIISNLHESAAGTWRHNQAKFTNCCLFSKLYGQHTKHPIQKLTTWEERTKCIDVLDTKYNFI